MSGKLRTVSRSYSTISREAHRCRGIGNLSTSIIFNIVDFIKKSLIPHFRGRLNYVLEEEGAFLEPACVVISGNKSSILLRVKKSIWLAADRGDGESRRILAHEIGHIWLHKDETFAFSEVSDAEHPYIARDELVEEQAHDFSDVFLLSDDALNGFDKASDVSDYCDMYIGVPEDVIARRFEIVSEMKRFYFQPRYSQIICPSCGDDKVIEVLSYRRCDTCKFIQY